MQSSATSGEAHRKPSRALEAKRRLPFCLQLLLTLTNVTCKVVTASSQLEAQSRDL